MQRPGTEAIRNHIQPSKPKREIIKYSKYKGNIWSLSQQLFFQKDIHSANQTELK